MKFVTTASFQSLAKFDSWVSGHPAAVIPCVTQTSVGATVPAASRRSDTVLLEFTEEWGAKCPASVRLWENAWAKFVPFLPLDREIRRLVCTTDGIESVNARIRKAVKARGHFPSEQAALKCVYLAVMALEPTGKERALWTQRWRAALNAFEISFDGRLSADRGYWESNKQP